jgi:hypothetical protein
VFQGQVRADYALSPGLAVFAVFQYNNRNYLKAPLPGTFNRDSSGYEGDVGADFEITQLIRGQVQVGYLDQSYRNHVFKDTAGVGAMGSIEYYPTQLLTVKANLLRTVNDAGLTNAPTYYHTGGGVELDYELLRNLIVTAHAQDSSDAYQGIDRTDGTLEARIGANYLFSRLLGFNLSYDYFNRTSSGTFAQRGFSDNRVQFGVVVQY